MQVKRFFAADMRQAMKLVRDELGADASIIGNRRIAGGVELTAALNYEVPAAPTRQHNAELEAELRKTQTRIAMAHAELSKAQEVPVNKDRQLFDDSGLKATRELTDLLLGAKESTPAAPAELLPVSEALDQGLDAVRSEINGLRELLEVQLGTMVWGQMQSQKPQHATLWRRLQRMGFSAEMAQQLLATVADISDTRHAWRMLLAQLARKLTTPVIEPIDENGVIALVGPAGMGKTTTLAKLAARYVLKYGAQNVAIASMDGYRIGAQEQLKTLGRILNVPVVHVDPEVSLNQSLAPLMGKKMVLVDTAGLPASDPALRMQLESLASKSLNARNYLVLATTSQGQVLKAAYHAYKACGLAGAILTKVDEAVNLGEALGLVMLQDLPIAYLCDGPKIPDDLHAMRAHHLVSRAVSLQAPEEPSEQAMAGLFAGLYNNGKSAS